MIAVEAVVRRFGGRFGSRAALDGVSFSVARGTLCALCGGNGAGKTTLLRVIAGYLDADGGRVTLEPDARLGYLPEGAPLPPELTVMEYLHHRGTLTGPGRSRQTDRMRQAFAQLVMGPDRLGDRIGTLSKGWRQRTAMAGVMMSGANVLLLDEPASGLDEMQRTDLRERLRRGVSEGGHTVLWSTHELSDVEVAADQVVVLAGGRVVANGDVAAIKAAAGTGDAPLREAVAVLSARVGA